MNGNTFENKETKCAASGFGAKMFFFAAGGAIGAAIALLFAPKPGKELRDDIADAAVEGYDRVRDTAFQIKEQGEKYFQAAKEKGSEVYTVLMQGVDELKNDLAHDAVVVGEKAEKIAEDVGRIF